MELHPKGAIPTPIPIEVNMYHCKLGTGSAGLIAFLIQLTCFLTVTVAQPVSGPVRTQGVLLPDTEWETTWFQIDSGLPGPTVLITGGMHGNEPAGFRAAEQIRHWPVERGRMIVVPRLNRLGIAANTRWIPAYRNDKTQRDGNRNFPRENARNLPRTELCIGIWEFVENLHPDWLIDLHEGFDYHVANDKSVGSSLICFDRDETRSIVADMHQAVNATIQDPQRQFVLLNGSGPVTGSLARAAAERWNCHSIILETTTKDQPLSTRVRQHRLLVSKLKTQKKKRISASMTDREPVVMVPPR
jgi:hypothetical protein